MMLEPGSSFMRYPVFSTMNTCVMNSKSRLIIDIICKGMDT